MAVVERSRAEISDMLHALGREFGATTGRPRRVGWFDSVATRHAAMVNGTAAHAMEVDDIFKDGIYHPGAPTIPAARAISE